MWGQTCKQRDFFWRVGWTLFGLGILALVVSVFGSDLTRGATSLLLLGTHALTAHNLLARIAHLQAALDMKRLHRFGAGPLATQKFNVNAGDSVTVSARDGSKFDISASTATTLVIRYIV